MKILIKNGQIIDGTGSPGYKADVLINGDRIERINEEISVEDAEIIDASGKIVTPGFIDIHNHADFNIYDVNRAESFVMQGMTTLLVGLCGTGIAPANKVVEEYYADFGKKAFSIEPKLYPKLEDCLVDLKKKGVSLNLAFLVPQGNVRGCVMGLDMRPATDDELEKMKDLVRNGMEAGAFGLSTGLVYPPGSATPIEELIELSKVVAEYDGIYDSHMRNEGAKVLDVGMAEVIRIAREAKVKAHISHWSVISRYKIENLTANAIKMFRDALDEGLKMTADVVPYDDGVTSLPFVILESWVFENFAENLTKPETRKRIKDEIFQRIFAIFLAGAPWYLKLIPKFIIKRLMPPVIAKQVVLLHTTSGEFNGKTLYEALKIRYPDSKMLDALLDFMRDEEGGIVIRIQFKDEERSVIPLLKQPFACVSSDAVFIPRANNHPRTFSAFPRVIERIVREKNWMSLEEAVKKITSLPATILGIPDRGVLKEGKAADIVVFDYDKIREMATFANGNQHPEGIDYVIVNGKITVEKGEHLGVLGGQILKHESN
ncbi:MAG: amidohydrolase family protein [Candidatus Helarchaeota archaeon]|nr:amidohydrolase family protein [Candidatus Helarchaeota archaeon]